jgi:hypothetical protein
MKFRIVLNKNIDKSMIKDWKKRIVIKIKKLFIKIVKLIIW